MHTHTAHRPCSHLFLSPAPPYPRRPHPQTPTAPTAIPLELFISSTSLQLVSTLKAARLLRLRRFWNLFSGKDVKLSSALAVFRLFFMILLAVHLLACLWCVVAGLRGR
jgi:hypothetical protein